MTTLDAVNEILQALGEPPVLALDTGGTTLEAEAEAMLDRQRVRVLTEGWHCNTIPEKTYTPDGSDNIVLTNVLRVRPVGVSRYLRVTIRDGMLYDLEDDVNTFESTVTLEVATLLTLVELPPKLADYVVKNTAWHFQRYIKRGEIDDQFLRQEIAMARSEAKQEENDTYPVNLLKGLAVYDIQGRRRSVNYGY